MAEPKDAKPVVDEARAAWEAAFNERFGYENIKECKPFLARLKYHDAVYVDNDGQEYRAKLCPIPWNKVREATIPAVADFGAEMERIQRLSPEQQVRAHQELMERNGKQVKAILQNGKYIRLFEAKPGVYVPTVPRNVGSGPTARTIDVPVGNLIVDFSRKENAPRFVNVEGVMMAGHVPTPAQGQNGPCHFKLV